MRKLLGGGNRRATAKKEKVSRARVVNALMAGLFVVLALLIFPPVTPRPSFDFELDEVTGPDVEIIAESDFQVPKDAVTLQREQAARIKEVLPVYRRKGGVAERVDDHLRTLMADVADLLGPDSLGADSLAAPLEDRLLALSPGLERSAAEVLLDHPSRQTLLSGVRAAAARHYRRGVLDNRQPIDLQNRQRPEMVVLGSDGEEILAAAQVPWQEGLDSILQRESRQLRGWDESLRRAFVSLGRTHLRPNLVYDQEETDQRLRAALESVPTDRPVYQGVRILGPHTQVTGEHLKILTAYRDSRGEQPRNIPQVIAATSGRLLYLIFLLFLAGRFLLLYRRDFFRDGRRMIFLSTLILVFLALSRLALGFSDAGQYLLPIVLVAMIVGGLYDAVLGMMATVLALLTLAGLAPVPFSGILVALLAGGAAVFSVQQIRNRLQLYKSILYVSLAYILGVAALEMGSNTLTGVVSNGLTGAMNGLVCSWLVMPILPLLERFFDLTTSFTLLELTDLNRPILKRMKVEAPGTFQHSLVVSNLAEAAAGEIGGNALLAKVCAYYHDIGKIEKPEYFSENQGGGRNKHDKLSPNMSALIISGHVRAGLDAAEKIKLPGVVRNGIPEHHGTTVMSFFYHKAQQQDSHGQVKADDFRYLGPKPQSAETAILMLADSVEATVRALDKPDAVSIRHVVTEAIERRLKEGELEECELSIRDLAKIRESFITTMLSIYHPRISYPDPIDDDKDAVPGRGAIQDETEDRTEPDIS